MSENSEMQLEMEGKTSKQLLQSGGKAYATQDFAAAVQYLSKASEVGVKEHEGDAIHNDLGELYLLYGKALLEFTRVDGDPLGADVPKDVAVGVEEADEEEDEGVDEDGEGEDDEKVDDDDDDSEENDDNAKNEEEEKAGDKGKDKGEKSKEKEKEKEKEKVGEKDNVKEDGGSASGIEFNGEKTKDEEGSDGDEEVEEDSGEEVDDAEPSTSKPEDEEPSDLEVAWECLELAKGIFTARGEAGKSNLADTLIALGEISLENENFEGGIADIKDGLDIQKKLYDDASRVLAETHYKLGMAYAMGEDLPTAIENFQRSIELLQNRIKKIEGSDKNIHKEEIEDIKKLIPEIEDKITDCKDLPEEKAIPTAPEDPRPILPGSPEKKAKDISHLVKRKRKSEESGEGPSNVPKKPALE